MTLSFPNLARSFDDTKGHVRFLGHDGLFEIRFFLPVEILAAGLSSQNPTERDYLAAFDKMRLRIQDIAKRAYGAGRRSTVMLDAKNFK